MRVICVLLLAALSLTACETTAEKSADLAKVAKRTVFTQRGLQITHVSTVAKIVSTATLHSSAGSAVVVRLRNVSAHALQHVPIEITTKDAHGRVLFRNDAAGLEAGLTSLASLPPHSEATWIDDQIPATGSPASASAVIGEAKATGAAEPRIVIGSVHESEEGGTGALENRSNVTQLNLVVDVLAHRGGKLVAAGRAVLAEVKAGASVPFQVFFVGDPKGAQLEASAPATTRG